MAAVKSGHIVAASDVFPEEPLAGDHPVRTLPGFLRSAHRAGALDIAFKRMGDMVLEDMDLIDAACRRCAPSAPSARRCHACAPSRWTGTDGRRPFRWFVRGWRNPAHHTQAHTRDGRAMTVLAVGGQAIALLLI